jgi:hypothetical protein
MGFKDSLGNRADEKFKILQAFIESPLSPPWFVKCVNFHFSLLCLENEGKEPIYFIAPLNLAGKPFCCFCVTMFFKKPNQQWA